MVGSPLSPQQIGKGHMAVRGTWQPRGTVGVALV